MLPPASQFARNHTRLCKAPGSLSAAQTAQALNRGSCAVLVYKCPAVN